MNLIERVILKVIKGRVNKWFDMERSLGKLEHVNKPTELSPEKSWPDPNKIPSGNEVPFSLRNMPIVGHHLRSCISEGMKAIKSIDKNPYNSVKNISSGDLKSFEEFANSQGIGTTSYCKLPSHLIFKDRAVLYNYAIVLTKEMDKDAILKAPSLDTFKMVMSTYDELGVITNTLTSKLTDRLSSISASLDRRR